MKYYWNAGVILEGDDHRRSMANLQSVRVPKVTTIVLLSPSYGLTVMHALSCVGSSGQTLTKQMSYLLQLGPKSIRSLHPL